MIRARDASFYLYPTESHRAVTAFHTGKLCCSAMWLRRFLTHARTFSPFHSLLQIVFLFLSCHHSPRPVTSAHRDATGGPSTSHIPTLTF